MVAVPEVCASAPTAEAGAGQLSLLVHCHRVVAIVDTTVELLRPESDLLRTIAGIGQIDVLVALDDAPVATPGPVGLLPGPGDPPDVDPAASDVDEYEDARRVPRGRSGPRSTGSACPGSTCTASGCPPRSARSPSRTWWPR